MSEGKFSQPRPYREEDRQIEESFRQLTEEKNRRRKPVYNVEEEIQNTVREITEQEVSLPTETGLPFERSVRLEETIQVNPEQIPVQPPVVPPQPTQRKPKFDLIPEDPDAFCEENQPIPEEDFPESEPDFIDKMLDFFRKYQTPAILGLCGAALLLIVLFVSIFFTGGSKQEDNATLAGNILIAGVNINGMTKEQAVDAVTEVANTTYLQNDMVVDFGTAQLALSPKDTGIQIDAKAAVEAAFTMEVSQEQRYIALLPYMQLNTDYIYGTLSSYAQDTGSTLTQTSYGLEGSEPNLSADGFNPNAPTQTLIIVMGTPGIGFDVQDVYEKVLDAYSFNNFLVEVKNVEAVNEPDPIDLDAVYKEYYIAPVNASVNLQNFETKAGSYGYGFDLEAARQLIAKAQPGEVLRIPMEFIAPDVLDNDAFFKDALGQHQTRGTGDENRNRNLQLACGALNGTVLNPGETLSFSSILRKAGGFYFAPEDTGLDATDQGGVTQVASTLYYAALLSDLSISSRSSHNYMPSFIDYGLDATETLSLINSTGYPIRIDAEYAGGYVKVAIWGTEERTHYVMLESSITGSIPSQTIYEEFSYDNAEGYLDGDVIEEGSAGYMIKTYKVKYDRKTARELSRDFLTNSQYPAVDRIVAQVEAPPETEPPTEPPTLPPVTVPPVTEPPVTVPPVTEPPVTEPPVTVSPVTTPPTEVPAQPAETTPPTEAPIAETQPEAVSDVVTE